MPPKAGQKKEVQFEQLADKMLRYNAFNKVINNAIIAILKSNWNKQQGGMTPLQKAQIEELEKMKVEDARKQLKEWNYYYARLSTIEGARLVQVFNQNKDPIVAGRFGMTGELENPNETTDKRAEMTEGGKFSYATTLGAKPPTQVGDVVLEDKSTFSSVESKETEQEEDLTQFDDYLETLSQFDVKMNEIKKRD